MTVPPGKYFTMLHFLEYPFSRGSIHINSPNPYEAPDFDTGFMNDKRDMAPMVWGYIKSRETARRMQAFAGELTSRHPYFSSDSPARALDMDLATATAYALPGNLTSGIATGAWTMPTFPAEPPKANLLTSAQQGLRKPIKYSKKDLEEIELWGKRTTAHFTNVESWTDFNLL
jgi:alcohol oxidase